MFELIWFLDNVFVIYPSRNDRVAKARAKKGDSDSLDNENDLG